MGWSESKIHKFLINSIWAQWVIKKKGRLSYECQVLRLYQQLLGGPQHFMGLNVCFDLNLAGWESGFEASPLHISNSAQLRLDLIPSPIPYNS